LQVAEGETWALEVAMMFVANLGYQKFSFEVD